MTLCDNTLMVLKNFAGINNSILVKKGSKLRTMSVAKNILAEAAINEDFYEPKRAHFYKYHEEEILKDIEEYVSGTYQGHYTGNSHEYRKVQTIDLMASKDLAAAFCQANILKYGSRYGNKDGKNKKDLMKVIHYAMLLLHFDNHYGEPSMPSGNFEQMP